MRHHESITKNLDRIDELLLLVRARMAAIMRDGSTGTLNVKVPFTDGGMRRVFLTEETVLSPGKEDKPERGEKGNLQVP